MKHQTTEIRNEIKEKDKTQKGRGREQQDKDIIEKTFRKIFDIEKQIRNIETEEKRKRLREVDREIQIDSNRLG